MAIIEDIPTKESYDAEKANVRPGLRTADFKPILVLQTTEKIETITGKKEIFELTFDIQPMEKVNITGAQNIAVFKNPGGTPSYQSVGPDTAFMSWEGIFVGDAAFDTANNLVKVRDSGVSLYVLFGPLFKKAVIRYFNHSIKRFDVITYQIGLYIERDLDDVTFFGRFEPIARKYLPDYLQGYADLLDAAQDLSGSLGGTIRGAAQVVFETNNIIDRQIQAWGKVLNIPAANLKGLSKEIDRALGNLLGTKNLIYANQTYRKYLEILGYAPKTVMGVWQ